MADYYLFALIILFLIFFFAVFLHYLISSYRKIQSKEEKKRLNPVEFSNLV